MTEDEDAAYRQRRNDQARANNAFYKKWVIDAYGGKCVCCEESNEKFLSIDHVNSDGHVDRKKFGNSTGRRYKRIVDEWFPDTYQLMCFNCNLGRALNGG